jgi:outer membrane lipoprotein-sorting protein
MNTSRPAACLATLALALGVLVPSGISITADELARQVEDKYRSFETLSMDFVRMVRSKVFETKTTVQGKMIFKNPDKFRIETQDETVTSDGKFVWTYSAENAQVIKNLADRSEDFFKPYQYLSDFRSRYVPRLEGEEKVDGTRCFKLVLTPKEDDAFIINMTVWVDQKSLLAQKLIYQDLNGNQVTLTFRHIKPNRKIKDSEFVYQAPPGVEEVDLSQ